MDELLLTARLGDGVGRKLGLEQVMRWQPAIADGQRGPKETGLFKIRGVTVEALVGAIYHHYVSGLGAIDRPIDRQADSLPSAPHLHRERRQLERSFMLTSCLIWKLCRSRHARNCGGRWSRQRLVVMISLRECPVSAD